LAIYKGLSPCPIQAWDNYCRSNEVIEEGMISSKTDTTSTLMQGGKRA